LSGTGAAASEQVDLPIGRAVRVRSTAWAFMYGSFVVTDYWFFVGDQLLVLTKVGAGSGSIDQIAQSIRPMGADCM
ncbi:MAG TPA: hypothetical protein VLS28_07390, partial [Candidatus Sulfomarinibacteraceae bacterium]|nr:hypothetical protein [Candidatus Sulfomarinibacteraceae bacterium]